MVRHLAYAPRRIAFDGLRNGTAHADDVMRDNARALLRLHGKDGRALPSENG